MYLSLACLSPETPRAFDAGCTLQHAPATVSPEDRVLFVFFFLLSPVFIRMTVLKTTGPGQVILRLSYIRSVSQPQPSAPVHTSVSLGKANTYFGVSTPSLWPRPIPTLFSSHHLSECDPSDQTHPCPRTEKISITEQTD